MSLRIDQALNRRHPIKPAPIHLAKLQQDFLQGLYFANTANMLTHIQVHPTLSAASQFDIYRDSVQGKLYNTLQALYPVCKRLVGADFFLQLARGYCRQTPSTTYDLNAYGESFSHFISQYTPANTLPYLPDVAKLEWAWHRLYGAPWRGDFDFAKLATRMAAGGEDAIIFTLPPYSTLLSSPYPVHQIFALNQVNADTTSDEEIILQHNQHYTLFIWHHHQEFFVREVPQPHWQLLHWVQAGFTLADITHQLELTFPHHSLGDILPDCVKNGWIHL